MNLVPHDSEPAHALYANSLALCEQAEREMTDLENHLSVQRLHIMDLVLCLLQRHADGAPLTDHEGHTIAQALAHDDLVSAALALKEPRP